jgi:membrane-associated phospholipid phosphatase
MVLLGWTVGKGSTGVDDWFHSFRDSPARRLLFFTDPRVLALVVVVSVAVGVSRRQWQLATAVVLAPVVAIVLAQLLKPLFGREVEGALAYPSGHTTFMVVVLGMVVLVAGVALWAVLVAVAWCLLGMIGQGVTYHYFTDTVGAMLLGTAIVCVAALTLRHAPHRT